MGSRSCNSPLHSRIFPPFGGSQSLHITTDFQKYSSIQCRFLCTDFAFLGIVWGLPHPWNSIQRFSLALTYSFPSLARAVYPPSPESLRTPKDPRPSGVCTFHLPRSSLFVPFLAFASRTAKLFSVQIPPPGAVVCSCSPVFPSLLDVSPPHFLPLPFRDWFCPSKNAPSILSALNLVWLAAACRRTLGLLVPWSLPPALLIAQSSIISSS